MEAREILIVHLQVATLVCLFVFSEVANVGQRGGRGGGWMGVRYGGWRPKVGSPTSSAQHRLRFIFTIHHYHAPSYQHLISKPYVKLFIYQRALN